MTRFFTTSLLVAALLGGVAVLPGCNGANDNALNAVDTSGQKGFMIKTLVRGDRVRKYGLFVPTTYSPNSRYPVIIFLHGMGEGGSDAHANLRVGLAPFVAARMSEFPFICIFPQSETGGWDENSPQAQDVIFALDDVSKQYSVDQDRVSLTGLSTGGYGTWAIGAKYKNRFAALVPMGSSSSPEQYADQLVDMPIWSFHNTGDMFAGSWNDSGMCAKINTLGGHAKFTPYPLAGHDCWETAYGDGELFAWLITQRRHGTAAAPVSGRSTSDATPSQGTPGYSPVATPAYQPRSNSNSLVPTPY
jgi:predicted peptidase